MVEAMDTFCGRGRQGTAGHGTGRDSIDNLSQSFGLLAWLGSAFAEVCQLGTKALELKHETLLSPPLFLGFP